MSNPQNRNHTFDYVRVFSLALIVCLHMNGLKASLVCSSPYNINTIIYSILIILFSLPVPLFFLLSGALIISKDNTSAADFYRHSFKRLLLPWGIIFFFYHAFYHTAHTIYWQGKDIFNIENIWLYAQWCLRGGIGTIWFLITLIGLYVFAPFLIWLRKKTNLLIFCSITILTLFITYTVIIPQIGHDYYTLPINWFKCIYFVGLFMLGHCIYQSSQKLKSLKISPNIFLSLFCFISIIYIYYLLHYFCLPEEINKTIPFSLSFLEQDPVSAQLPINILLSSILFLYFSCIQLPYNRIVNSVASVSLVLYLSHAVIPLPILHLLWRKFGVYTTLYRSSLPFALVGYLTAYILSISCTYLIVYLEKKWMLRKKSKKIEKILNNSHSG